MYGVTRSPVRATLKAAIVGGVGLGILIALFLASLVVAYVAFGDTPEASSALEPETLISAVAVKPADVGGTRRNDKESGSFAGSTSYFPAGYVNQGRDGDGNVKTYEHD